MICIYVPKALAEEYYAQGWEIMTLAGRHADFSVLAQRRVDG